MFYIVIVFGVLSMSSSFLKYKTVTKRAFTPWCLLLLYLTTLIILFLILSTAFEYKNDSVLEVDKWDFYHCNSSAPISSFKNGKSVVKLERPGSFYFISGDSDHCKTGQRLVVGVMSPHPISDSPPTIALPPGSYFPISPSPSPISNSGVLISVTLIPSLMAPFIAAIVGLV